jgi:hypothetical protein
VLWSFEMSNQLIELALQSQNIVRSTLLDPVIARAVWFKLSLALGRLTDFIQPVAAARAIIQIMSCSLEY